MVRFACSAMLSLVATLPLVASSAYAELTPGTIVVASASFDGVVAFDPSSGDFTFLSGLDNNGTAPGGAPVGGGVGFRTPRGIALDAARNLLVVDSDRDAVISVNPSTGRRTIVSTADSNGLAIGAGPDISAPTSIGLDATGNLLVTDAGLDAVISIDPVTGDRTTITDATGNRPPLVGSGPGFVGPRLGRCFGVCRPSYREPLRRVFVRS